MVSNIGNILTSRFNDIHLDESINPAEIQLMAARITGNRGGMNSMSCNMPIYGTASPQYNPNDMMIKYAPPSSLKAEQAGTATDTPQFNFNGDAVCKYDPLSLMQQDTYSGTNTNTYEGTFDRGYGFTPYSAPVSAPVVQNTGYIPPQGYMYPQTAYNPQPQIPYGQMPQYGAPYGIVQ